MGRLERLVIAYHEPGDPVGVEMVEALASRLSKRLGVDVATVPIKDVEEGRHGFRKGDLVVSLLPARGGHMYTVAEAAASAGARHVGPIPTDLMARGMASRLQGCGRVSIIYWPAKRFKEEQREDLEKLASSLSRLLGCEARLVEIGSASCDECMAASSLFPGRVSRLIGSCSPARAVPHLFGAIEGLLEEWLEALYKSAGARGGEADLPPPGSRRHG